MSPALNGSSTLQRFEHGNAVEKCNRIMFDFYPGLPHMQNNGATEVGLYRWCVEDETPLCGKQWLTYYSPAYVWWL